MDKSLLIFIAIVALFTFRGYRNGLLKSVGRILGIVAGYVCAIVYTGTFSGVVESHSGLHGIVAFIVASLILFVGASLVVGILFWFFTRLLSEGREVSTVSSAGGAAVGVLTGMLVAIIVVWAFAFIRDIQPSGDNFEVAAAEPAAIEKIANRMAGGAVDTAMSMAEVEPEVHKISAALVKSPGKIVQQAQRLSNSPELQQLLREPRNQQVLNSGDVDAVSRLPDFQQLARNPEMQAFMQSTGLLEHAVANDQDLDQALAQQLTNVWLRTQRVKNDPRVHAILQDAQFQQQVQSGNPIELLSNQKLLELANIIFSEDEAPAMAPAPGQASAIEPAKPVKKKKKIYTWTDENGKLHISDVKPDS